MFMVIVKIVFIIGGVAAASLLLTEVGIRYFGVEDAAWVGIAAFACTSVVGAVASEAIDWFRFNRIVVTSK